MLIENAMGPETNFEDRLKRLNEIIQNCDNVIFFGGAGVSTGSGIPDFRSQSGLYNNVDKKFTQHSPEYYLSDDCFHHNPKLFFEFYKTYMDARNYEPNACHLKLAELENSGKLKGIITQNIDMLHEKAGSKNICKIHGTIGKNHCIKCNKEFDIDYIFDSKDLIPKCTCQKEYNIVRPNVTLYGESLPVKETNKAMELIDGAKKNDCLIIAGTSLTVYPACTYVSMFKGLYIVIINRDPTSYDQYSDIVFREDICEVFKNIKS